MSINFWTVVTAAVSAVAAAVYTWLTFSLVRSQGEPKVVVFACGDSDRPSVIMIRIANIGRDVATDVSFVTSRPIPEKAFGLDTSGKVADVMRDGPLVKGIPVLGPGDTRDITWGQFGGLSKALGGSPIDLEFSYRHGRRKMKGHSRLEVASFNGTDASENPASKIAAALTEIAKSLEEIQKDCRRPHMERQQRAYHWRKLLERLSNEAAEADPTDGNVNSTT
jgi:hypothetical protein